MGDTPRGLYEALITRETQAALDELGERLVSIVRALRPADAADRIALHVSRVVQRAVADAAEHARVELGVALTNRLIETIGAPEQMVEPPGATLHALLARTPDGRPEEMQEPLIPLLDTTLLTNAPGEPGVGSQLRTEIHSADRIDLVMAFIRHSGIRPFIEALRAHCQRGRELRVLTTTYTGSTEPRALDLLRDLGAQVRVSYDTGTTRLHAKAWLFHRTSGYSTAYIGSSNLTHSAQVTGLEWNVRVSGARNADVVDKVRAMFESYWDGGDFVPYESAAFLAAIERPAEPDGIRLSPIEVRLEPFQERLLEQVALSRARGHHRNLLVSATGTGKTVMAAVDHARLRERLPRARLLFVAHREEILAQSLATFQQCLRDSAFGELWVGGRRPRAFEHVFASIQSLHAAGLADLAPDHFDVVIVDEFHHAAAPSYEALLAHLRPVELLGLTATPERADGLPLLHWFDDRIAAELRLWDAIDQHRLAPFTYYGIHDGLDLRDIPWRRGRGYDVEALTGLFTANDVWARRVIAQLARRVDDVRRMRALGFCVSVGHARFMARVFNEAGIPATAVWADSRDDERKAALADLQAGRLNVVFSVDLFNEGVDVPSIDTLLLLRPTDSATLFIQQLGRGLRRAHGKASCTVLDFVGHHRKEFRFDRRLRAVLGGSRGDLVRQIEEGFPFLPSGCHMELDRVATDIVLASIRDAVPTRWTAKVDELRRLGPVALGRYLAETGVELEELYTGNRSWSQLREDAGLPVAPRGPAEETLRRACGRLLHVDDPLRLARYRELVTSPPSLEDLSAQDRRLLRMLIGSVTDKAVDRTTSLADGLALLREHPQVRAELAELFDVLADRVDHVHDPIATHPELPLQLHARYSRIEILAAFGIGETAKVAPWQTGVYWAKEARTDLLAFTIDKTTGQFSPTTRYRDYAIARDLIHWESQSATRADSDTGRRYQRHASMGTHVMLFARLRADDRAFWLLGPASYVRHESELPMAITWRLHHPLPGDLYAKLRAAS
ncbi:MAG: DUF3427 domain-containing protein [Deltaproteobacteria bacterium]|nr:DUF3427 domain-containing protein [Kofleriaceae bacterium]